MGFALFWDSMWHRIVETTIVCCVKSQMSTDINELVVLHGLFIHLIQYHVIIICRHVSQTFIKTTHTYTQQNYMVHSISNF